MKTISRLLAAAALVVGCSAGLASCHDHDEVCSDANNNTEQLANTELTADALRHVLYHTTALDTLPSNWTSGSFTVEPTCGDCMDQSNPRVRTVVAGSTADAVELFRLMTNQDDETYSKTWSHDSIGTIVLNTDSTETLYATIDVNVQQLNLDQIRFVPESALGANWASKKWRPCYHFGDVLEVKKKNPEPTDHTEYWICVRGEFSDENISSNKKMAHWVCFDLDREENVEHCSGNITLDAPKNLHGEHIYLQNLPKLLYLIFNPTEAFSKWRDLANADKPVYGGYCFFGDPFPLGYLYSNDFNRISNNILTAFSGSENLKKLIPALGSYEADALLKHFAAGKPLAFICDDVSFPFGWKNFNPVTFKGVRKYSGDFYTTYQKYNVKYDFTGEGNKVNFDIRKVVEQPYSYMDGKFATLYSDLAKGEDTKVLVVRYKSADKFDGIQNPKNYGHEYTSTTLDFNHIVADAYEDEVLGHQSTTYQVTVSDPFLLGDVVSHDVYSGKKNALCVGYQKNDEFASSDMALFVVDGTLSGQANRSVCSVGFENTLSIAFNVLNGYLVENGVNIKDYLVKQNQNYDWDLYIAGVKAMRENSKILGTNENGGCLLDDYFVFSNEDGIYSVEMNYRVMGETKSLELSYGPNRSVTRYKCVYDQDAVGDGLMRKYTVCHFTDVPRAYFKRVKNMGESYSQRKGLAGFCKDIYTVLSDCVYKTTKKK